MKISDNVAIKHSYLFIFNLWDNNVCFISGAAKKSTLFFTVVTKIHGFQTISDDKLGPLEACRPLLDCIYGRGGVEETRELGDKKVWSRFFLTFRLCNIGYAQGSREGDIHWIRLPTAAKCFAFCIVRDTISMRDTTHVAAQYIYRKSHIRWNWTTHSGELSRDNERQPSLLQPEPIFFCGMQLKDAQSRAIRMYADEDGPRVFAILSPPGESRGGGGETTTYNAPFFICLHLLGNVSFFVVVVFETLLWRALIVHQIM